MNTFATLPGVPFPLRRPLVLAVLVSFLVLLGSAWIRGGVGSTSYDTVDSQGRKMGFNDVFSAEHYGIILRNASWEAAIHQMEKYDCALAAAHGLILFLIFHLPSRHLKAVLWLQPVLFFWGVIGLYALPLEAADLLYFHSSDREGFIDIPYISILGQGAWLWACFFMLWKLRKQRVATEYSRSPATPAST
ncbi:MAG TPA: hypothetical protein VHM91_08205 [Verrucomicrobiales bacterium]|jgi:hypothetical protein|nr:hypothetical protein [Verrucomicrobiales bacterium]